MKKFNVILILFVVSITSYGQKGCENFITGDYTYKEEPYNKTKVHRTKKFQFEHNKLDGMKLKFKIEWVSPCEYNLTYVKINDKSFKDIIGKTLKVIIIEVIDPNTYKYLADYYGEKTSFTIIRN